MPQILIYHSHNRESWLPELSNVQTANEAFDSKTNVTLLGDYLIKRMKSYDIPVFHSKKIILQLSTVLIMPIPTPIQRIQ